MWRISTECSNLNQHNEMTETNRTFFILNRNEISPKENFFQFTYLLAFMATVTLQTFLYTYYGHGVLSASDALSNAVYSSKWYNLLPDLGKPLVILMERLKRKCEILAGKLFPMNLALFGKVCRSN